MTSYQMVKALIVVHSLAMLDRTTSTVPGFLASPIRCRWALNSSDWELSDTDKRHLLSLLPSEERVQCTRFLRSEDQKRALASRLLQRLLGALAFHAPFTSVKISRTSCGKPFFSEAPATSGNVNFNVAHDVRFQLCPATSP